MEKVQHELLESPETTYNFEVVGLHTYYVGNTEVLVHNECVAKKGNLQAIVNPSNETEAPHAHILNNGKRVAKINANGEIISGAKDKQIVRFVSKFKEEITEGIKRIYPQNTR